MSFKLVVATTIKRDVPIETPANTTLTAEGVEFKYMDEEEFRAFAEEKGDPGLSELVLGWDKFLDGAGDPIKFNKTNLKQLFEQLYVANAFSVVYTRAVMGIDSKNFRSSLALGQLSQARSAKKPSKKKTTRKRNSKR